MSVCVAKVARGVWRERQEVGVAKYSLFRLYMRECVCVALNVQIFRADMADKWISGIEKSIANHRIRKRVRATDKPNS